MLKTLAQIGDTASTAAAAGTMVLAQTGVEPWIPLIITILNGIFLLLQGNKARKKAQAQPLPRPADLTGHDIEPAE